MGVDDLTNGNVDNRLGEGDQVRVLIYVKFILQLRDVRSGLEESSESKQQEPLAGRPGKGTQTLPALCSDTNQPRQWDS